MAHKLPHPCPLGSELLHLLPSLCEPDEGNHLHHEALAGNHTLLYNEMMGYCATVPHSDISQLDKHHLLIALNQNPNWHSIPPSPPPCLTWHHPALRSAKQPLSGPCWYYSILQRLVSSTQLSMRMSSLPELQIQKVSILLLKGSVPSYSTINSPNPKTSSPHTSFKCPTVTFKCSVRPPRTACVSTTEWCG